MDLRVKIKTMVNTTQDIPAMPTIWLKIRELTQQKNVSASIIAGEILKDQGTTTRLLKVANSAAFNRCNKKISTVTEAVVHLGFNEVRNVVMGYAVSNMLVKLQQNEYFDFKGYWVHSLATAVASRMIAETVRYTNTEEAFVAGLLHDIGKLVISQLMPAEYGHVLQRIAAGSECLHAEDGILKVDHQEIGRWVAERWHFPEILICTISRHHREELAAEQRSQYKLVDIVAVADQMANIIFTTGNKNCKTDVCGSQQTAFDLLGVNKGNWSFILRNLATSVGENIEDYNLSQADIELFLANIAQEEAMEIEGE